jgi:hypothetical protein
MKKLNWALIIVIGVCFMECATIGDMTSSGESTVLEGKWKNPDSSAGATYKFSGSHFTFTRTNGQYESGTFVGEQ